MESWANPAVFHATELSFTKDNVSLADLGNRARRRWYIVTTEHLATHGDDGNGDGDVDHDEEDDLLAGIVAQKYFSQISPVVT